MRLRILSMTALAMALAAGCAGYRLGSTLPKDIQTINVPIFVNKTGEPEVDDAATRATISEFQNDGTLGVTTAADADLILDVTVRDIQAVPLRFDRNRTTTAQEYRLTLTVDMVAKRRSSGSVFIQREGLQGETTFTLTSDIRSAKREAMPRAAKDLAHHIVQAVVESW